MNVGRAPEDRSALPHRLHPIARSVALIAVFAALGMPRSGIAPAAAAAPNSPALERVIAGHDIPSTPADRQRTPLSPDPNRVVYFVRPADTDPKIDHFLKDHYVIYNRAVRHNGRIFLFLPGTFATPSLYQFVLDEAAQAGYKAIGLEYVDDTPDPRASAVGQICVRNPDPACSARVRLARMSGGDAGPGASVTPANSIDNRLAKLLAYLDRIHPAEGWAAYLSRGAVAWSRVAVGGHSQGAGMAAFTAKQRAVARVALWSGPADYVAATRSLAPWISAPGATPADRWYAIVHRDEIGAQRLLAAYAALGIPGTPAIVNGAPTAAAHEFIVTLPPAPGLAGPWGAAHSSVAVDRLTPRDMNGRPVYAAVWDAMIGP
jgi:hypothetical protein